MTPFTALRASLIFPLSLTLVLSPLRAIDVSAAPRHALAAPRAPDADSIGKALYLQHCKACHGVLGAPTKLAAKRYAKIPDLTDRGFFTNRSNDSIMVVLTKGTGRDMKSFMDKMSTDAMRAVIAYVRTLAEPH